MCVCDDLQCSWTQQNEKEVQEWIKEIVVSEKAMSTYRILVSYSFECTPLQMNNSKSKTEIRCFCPGEEKKTHTQKWNDENKLPLIYTLFTAVEYNLYCVFYENRVFHALALSLSYGVRIYHTHTRIFWSSCLFVRFCLYTYTIVIIEIYRRTFVRIHIYIFARALQPIE